MDFSRDIRRNRFFDFEVDIRATGGNAGTTAGPSADTTARTAAAGSAAGVVGVRQTNHDFFFGSNIFGLIRGVDAPDLARYRETVLRLWNFGTLPFYWGRYEPIEGAPDEEHVIQAAKWARGHGLTTKGHPLCWHTVCADWLLEYDDETILQMQLDRVRREVGGYAGVIDMWDVINEVVIMPVFDRYDNAVSRICRLLGPIELTLRCFRSAREANPRATLLINDFNLSPDYERLIEELLGRDCPIDAIGLQSHQHKGYHGAEFTLDAIERFSRFGRPLHFTETTILSGHPTPPDVIDLNDYQLDDWPSTPEGEARQAEQVAEYYSAIFSHPATAAVVWWDLRDGGWLGAPAGLFRRDLTAKPAVGALERLIRGEWWLTATDRRVDSDGRVRFSGTAGTYEIVAGGSTYTVHLDSKTRAASL